MRQHRSHRSSEPAMKSLATIATFLIITLVASDTCADPSGAWRLDTTGAAGPVAQVALPDVKGKRRTAFVAVEYARTCDPIFSFIEITGRTLGAPVSQSVLKDSKIGIVLNGEFYTWHAARTNYANGYEAGFGIPNDLALQLLTNVDSLEFVTPSGEKIRLPSENFSKVFQSAIEFCRKRVK